MLVAGVGTNCARRVRRRYWCRRGLRVNFSKARRGFAVRSSILGGGCVALVASIDTRGPPQVRRRSLYGRLDSSSDVRCLLRSLVSLVETKGSSSDGLSVRRSMGRGCYKVLPKIVASPVDIWVCCVETDRLPVLLLWSWELALLGTCC